jgi:uncharacterized hydrophobic protein (TIGR00271 family)
MPAKFALFRTSPERLEAVIQDIEVGSEPQLSFFTLLGAASLIASFGLIANSTAVVIGAMLVSPLMTPIFGISLGMLRGDWKLLRNAFTAEVTGVALAVGLAYLAGLTPILVEPQPEMVSRIEPTLLDLLVAVFAGFAGAFALVDERISPALPGVAIATAIVPPLSTAGLYLSLGHEGAALGAFLLFVANFASILLVGLLTFAGAGISPTFDWKTPSEVVRRFGFAAIGFLVIVIFLSRQIGHVVENRVAVRTINRVLSEYFGTRRSTLVEKVGNKDFEWVEDAEGYRERVHVLVTLRSPEMIDPTDVTAAELKLSRALDKRAVLVVRSIVQKEVAAIGSNVAVSRTRDEGGLFDSVLPEEQSNARLAEQVLLEHLSDEPGFSLDRVLWGEHDGRSVVVASVQALRSFSAEEVRVLRNAMRERLQLPSLELFIRADESRVVTKQERYLFGWTRLSELTPSDEPLSLDLHRIVREEVERIADLACVDVHFRTDPDGPWGLLAEPVETTLWYRSEVVVTPDGYRSYDDYTAKHREERIRYLPKIFTER